MYLGPLSTDYPGHQQARQESLVTPSPSGNPYRDSGRPGDGKIRLPGLDFCPCGPVEAESCVHRYEFYGQVIFPHGLPEVKKSPSILAETFNRDFFRGLGLGMALFGCFSVIYVLNLWWAVVGVGIYRAAAWLGSKNG